MPAFFRFTISGHTHGEGGEAIVAVDKIASIVTDKQLNGCLIRLLGTEQSLHVTADVEEVLKYVNMSVTDLRR